MSAEIIELGVRVVPEPRKPRPLDLPEQDYALVGEDQWGTNARKLMGANDNATPFGTYCIAMRMGASAIPGYGITGCWHLV